MDKTAGKKIRTKKKSKKIFCSLDGAEEHGVVHSLRTEEFLTGCGVAAEDIDMLRCVVGEVCREEGGLNELGHRIPGDSLIWSEVNDLRFAEAFHVDQVRQLENELVDLLCVTYRCRVALFQVDRCAKAPAIVFLKLCNDLCVGQVVCCHLFHR